MIEIAPGIAIAEDEISESFIRASGPGGQNVNKVATAVQLRFDALGSPGLPDAVKARLRGVAGSRMTQAGEIIIKAERFRTLERNRQDALERLLELIRRATVAPKPRRPTRPTLASRERRRELKSRRADVKAARSRPAGDD